MGRRRPAKVPKVEKKKLKIIKEYEPIKQDILQNMIVYNANLGDQNMLLRAVTKEDLDGDLIRNGQVRVSAKKSLRAWSSFSRCSQEFSKVIFELSGVDYP